MGKKIRIPKEETLAEAPSVRKGETFRATKQGLQRLQETELRNGGKYNRKDELPYGRIMAVSHEERVTKKGSHILALLGFLLLIVGLGIPGASTIPMFSHRIMASRLAAFVNVSGWFNIASAALGFYLVMSRFPRKLKDEWWQVRAPGLGSDDLHGWQISGKGSNSEKLVDTIRGEMSRANGDSGANSR